MKFLLIRHGEMKGDPFACPAPPAHGFLSEEGCRQAAQTRDALKESAIHAAFSSPYGRALETARIVLQGRDVPLKVCDCLKEWLPNQALENIPSQKYEDIVAMNENRFVEETWKTELGEGCLEMCARIWPCMLRILDEYGIHHRMGGYVIEEDVCNHTLAFFAHGGSLAIALNFILGIPPFPLARFYFHLTGVAHVSFVEKQGIYYPQLEIPAK